MKKLLFLFVPLVFFFSCEDDNENPATAAGYNCAENGCVESASAESGYFANLEDCENNCNAEYCEFCTYTFAWVDVADDYEPDLHAAEAMGAIMAGYTDGELCDDALTDAKSAWEGMSDYADGMRSGDAFFEEECCNAEQPDWTHAAYHSHYIPAWMYTMTCVASE